MPAACCLLHRSSRSRDVSQADGNTLDARLTAVVTQGAKGAPAGPEVCTQAITAFEAPNGASRPLWRPQASMSSQRACLAKSSAAEESSQQFASQCSTDELRVTWYIEVLREGDPSEQNMGGGARRAAPWPACRGRQPPAAGTGRRRRRLVSCTRP